MGSDSFTASLPTSPQKFRDSSFEKKEASLRVDGYNQLLDENSGERQASNVGDEENPLNDVDSDDETLFRDLDKDDPLLV